MKKFAFLLLLLSSSAFAEVTGNTLMLGYQASVKSDNGVQLDGNERFQEIFFEGFVAGASESMDINAWCIPQGETVTHGQINDIVGAYLSSHPELRSKSGASLVQEALHQALPCN